MLVIGIQHSYTYTYIYIYICIFFHILFPYYKELSIVSFAFQYVLVDYIKNTVLLCDP